MKVKIINILKYLILIFIPAVLAFLFRAFRLAQGEKNEEIILGIIIGVLIDLIYLVVLFFIKPKVAHILVILITVFILLSSWVGVAYSDYSKVAISFDKPDFCISTALDDDGISGKYIGLGYSFTIDGHSDFKNNYQVDEYIYKILGITIKSDRICND